MAIAFASCEILRRSLRHSIVQRHAYNGRLSLVSRRTGEHLDYRDLGDLVGVDVLVPSDTPPPSDPAALWQEVELTRRRKDAVLGLELVLLLPTPESFPIESSIAMARDFIFRVVVEQHHLAATLAIHAPHREEVATEMASNAEDPFDATLQLGRFNVHAHILISPCQYGPGGFERRRYTVLDPVVRGHEIRGRDWGELWRVFQNETFFELGSSLRVTPNAPIPLAPVPLEDVRRWRRRALRRNPQPGGRGLLVNQAREVANQELAATIEGAIVAFRSVFTRGELEAFYRRHFGTTIAVELTSATIGLGACIEIDSRVNGQRWFATPSMVHRELALFGRALLLGRRTSSRHDVTPFVRQGFPPATAALLADIFLGPDLVIVDIDAAKTALAEDLCRTAEFCRLVPISIPGPAGHPLPKSVIIDPPRLGLKPVRNALILIDDPDAFQHAELGRALGAAVAAGSRVVLLRRRDSNWPRSELLDLIARHIIVLGGADAKAVGAPTATDVADQKTAVGSEPISLDVKSRPPNSAIAGRGDWPRLAVDEDGELVTRPHAIARMISLLTLDQSELQWADTSPAPHARLVILDEQLHHWIDRAEIALDSGAPVDDQLAIESAALQEVEGEVGPAGEFDTIDEADVDFDETWDDDWNETANVEMDDSLDR